MRLQQTTVKKRTWLCLKTAYGDTDLGKKQLFERNINCKDGQKTSKILNF